MAAKASQKDSIEIKRIALGYLVGLQYLKPELMNEVMNDSLKKITIGWDRASKKEYAKPTTKAEMIAFAESWNKSNTKFPAKPNNQIIVLDIYNRIANVKLVSDNWVEYLHLIKLDGKWSIANLIWQHKNISRYPKE
ncbi:nuclear transport factor 2 family protein [Winogradskyella sp. UBA3174]|uniref:nuclear transport factor 2 family protein n=1 Tax=Winogradskyella sp. UBA3174 TaxID=1947785 RepID=UPI0025D24C82|nr:nuclear transport factor 2 family protein [Winogradskyella sp. UBA3174]